MTDPIHPIPENFLASTADLVSFLAHMAGSSKLHSSQHRHDQELAGSALSILLRDVPTTVQLPPLAHGATVAAPEPAAQRAVARNAVGTSKRRTPAEAMGGAARQHQHCKCGQCKACLGNARWERIYNEKFADPTDYACMAVRHDSTLAEAR